MKLIVAILATLFAPQLFSQQPAASHNYIKGRVVIGGKPLPAITILLEGKRGGTISDSLGVFSFQNIPAGKIKLHFSGVGLVHSTKEITIKEGENLLGDINLIAATNTMEDVVVSGTMKAITKMESPIPVEVYTPVLFKKNPTPSIFESLGTLTTISL